MQSRYRKAHRTGTTMAKLLDDRCLVNHRLLMYKAKISKLIRRLQRLDNTGSGSICVRGGYGVKQNDLEKRRASGDRSFCIHVKVYFARM